MMRFPMLVGAALGVTGCATSFPHPIRAQDLTRFDSGDALTAYLRQPDASPAACNPRASGPHLPRFTDEVRRSVVRGLIDGQIEPGIWRRCIDAALAGASTEGAADLLDGIGNGYRSLIKDDALETSHVRQVRLTAMHELYLERPNGFDGHASLVSPMFDELREALDAHRLGPVAARFGEELLAAVDLERGRFRGRAVDVATIDDLYARQDEGTLRRFIERLPSKELRYEARRRVVRLEIAASTFPEVRAHGEEVEQRVLQHGTNRIPLVDHPPSRAWLDPRKTIMRGVLVRQDVRNQTATLFGYQGAGPAISVLPEVSLRGALWIEVPGWSRPVTLCQAAERIDPTPCVEANDVKIENPLAYLDQGGAFHFIDRITSRDAVSLAGTGQQLALPVSVGDRRLLSFDWPLYFQRPENLVFSGARSTQGPRLDVKVDRTDPARFLFTVVGEGATYRAVVEAADILPFRVASRGGPGGDGATGANGSDGSSGLDGSSASCPSFAASDGSRGSDGSDGHAGGDGGPGGDGGDIQVEVDCGATGCTTEVLDLLRSTIVSGGGGGGRGGSGGSGGRGGRGGSGGSGARCSDSDGSTRFLSSGNSGIDGRDGWNGVRGNDGPAGRAGQVQTSVVHTRPTF